MKLLRACTLEQTSHLSHLCLTQNNKRSLRCIFFVVEPCEGKKTRKKRRSLIAVETASRNWWEVLPLSRRAVDRRHSAEPPEQRWAGWCLSDGICVKYSALHGINVSEKPSQPSIKGQIIIKIVFFPAVFVSTGLKCFFFWCFFSQPPPPFAPKRT